ncbi:MAG: hypothetical protein K6A28_06130 [Bacteroidales bacterium]|nr:hypothetical protein [Bacteroidales bacterium]
MKRYLVIILACFASPLFAQVVQYGRAVEMNMGGRPLSTVTVTIPSVHDCQPTSSDSRGRFRVCFAEHHQGDVIHGIRAQKLGYEVVNIHVLRDWTLTEKDTLRIIMAPEGKVKEAKARYYDLVENAVVARYDSTMAFLKSQYEGRQLSEAELAFWRDEAEYELEHAYRRLDAWADCLARVCDDDRDESSVRLNERLKADDLEGAMALLADRGEEPVLATYQSYAVAFPLVNREEVVSAMEMDLESVPDSIASNLKLMQVYSRMLENDFAVSGMRYARACTYLGVLYRDMRLNAQAASYLTKAKTMFVALNEMGGDYARQIEKLDSWIREL